MKLEEQAVIDALQAFQSKHTDGFYYEETLQAFSLKKLQQFEPTTSFTYIRLFSQNAQLTIRKTRFGYEVVQLDDVKADAHLTYVKSRNVFIEKKDKNEERAYKKLLIDVYEHETAGYIEHWKGVE